MIDRLTVAALMQRVAAAGGADALHDAGMARCIELGYVAQDGGMVRLLDAGREHMAAAAARAGVTVDPLDADTIAFAMTAAYLELVEPEHRADTAAPPDEWTVPGA